MTDRLYRHPTDRVIAGVAGGLGAWLNVDPTFVRIAWVLLALFSGGLFVIVYIVMMIVVPLPPPGWTPRPRGSAGPGPGSVPGWQPGTTWDSGWSTPPAGSAPGDATGAPSGWTSSQAQGAWGTPPPGGWPAQPAWSPPRPGNAGLVVGIVLVGLGIWFLVDQYVRVDWELLWPVFIMVAGGALIAGALLRGRRD